MLYLVWLQSENVIYDFWNETNLFLNKALLLWWIIFFLTCQSWCHIERRIGRSLDYPADMVRIILDYSFNMIATKVFSQVSAYVDHGSHIIYIMTRCGSTYNQQVYIWFYMRLSLTITCSRDTQLISFCGCSCWYPALQSVTSFCGCSCRNPAWQCVTSFCVCSCMNPA